MSSSEEGVHSLVNKRSVFMFPFVGVMAVLLSLSCGHDKKAGDKTTDKPALVPGDSSGTVTPTPGATETPIPDTAATPIVGEQPPSNPNPSQPGTTPSPEPLVYEAIKPILQKHCGSCHIKSDDPSVPLGEAVETYPLTTKEDVLFYRTQIKFVLRPARCKMPPREPTFCLTDDAKKLAAWAASSAE